MGIPKHAKKVFQGHYFDVYHWPQELYDGSVTTFEALKRRNSVQILPTHNGKILLTKEEQPHLGSFYGFFGGGVESDDPLQCAKRELKEESGMVSNDWELLKVYNHFGSAIDWNVYLYAARDCKSVSTQKLDPGERIEVVPVDLPEFFRIIAKDGFRAVDIAFDLYKAKDDPVKLDSFKVKLFGSSKPV